MAVRKTSGPERSKAEAILSAALELFAERGFHGTTVPEVAKRARVGAGTVYRYFVSKEQIVNALYQYWKGEYGRALMSDVRFNVTPKALFYDLWRRMGSFALKYPKVLTFLELHHHGDYLDEKSRRTQEQLLVPIRGWVHDAQKRGALKADCSPEVLMALVYGAFNGLVRAAFNGYLEMTPRVMAAAADCAWNAVKA